MKKKLQKLLADACILFTVLAFVLFSIGAITVDYVVALSFGGTVLLFVTSIVLVLCSRILYAKKLHMIIRILLHYGIVLGAAFLIFAVIGRIVSTSLAALVLLAGITFLYTAIALAYALWTTRANKSNGTSYDPMFKK